MWQAIGGDTEFLGTASVNGISFKAMKIPATGVVIMTRVNSEAAPPAPCAASVHSDTAPPAVGVQTEARPALAPPPPAAPASGSDVRRPRAAAKAHSVKAVRQNQKKRSKPPAGGRPHDLQVEGAEIVCLNCSVRAKKKNAYLYRTGIYSNTCQPLLPP